MVSPATMSVSAASPSRRSAKRELSRSLLPLAPTPDTP